MTIIKNDFKPELFNEIIRQRVANYMDKEIKEMMRQKIDAIISDVLSNLQADAQIYKDMLRYETNLVVKAIYNGENIEQKMPTQKE